VQRKKTRMVVARLLRDAGHDVPDVDLASPPSRRL
jgi:hypothetical protein